MNRLHQKVIGVRPALVGPRRFANVHIPLGIANQPICKGEYRKYLVTILRNLPRLATSPKQFQRLAGRPQPSRPQKQHEKMEVGLAWSRRYYRSRTPQKILKIQRQLKRDFTNFAFW